MNISSAKISKRLEYRFASELSLVAGGFIIGGIGIIGGFLAVTKGITFFGSRPRFFKK